MNRRLGALVESNLAEWMLALSAAVPGVEVHLEDEKVCWTFTREPAPGNTVMLARFGTREIAEARARAILEYHLARRASSHWTIGPLTTPSDLGPAVLRPLGYSCRVHCAGMHCDLSKRAAMPRPQPTPNVTVRIEPERPLFEPVTTDRRRRQKAVNDAIAAQRPQRVWYFSATLGDKPAGRTTLFMSSNSGAGVYDVEVLKPARRRGIGAMLVCAALDHARSLGCAHAVLAATGAGQSVYERCGFREVTKISFWMYGKMRQHVR